MKWGQNGLVFAVEGNFGWMNSQAQVPTTLDPGDKSIIFFSSRATAGERSSDIEISGARGGNHKTRYFCQLEGVTPKTLELA